VQARDILATLYVNGRESTVQLLRHGSHRTVRPSPFMRWHTQPPTETKSKSN
jgi:hypothetical protein